MTDAPPPQIPPPDMPPPAPPAPERGFMLCGLMFFGGLIVVSLVSGFLASLLQGTAASVSGSFVFLVAIGVAIYFAIVDPRFRRCFLRGLAVNAALGVVVFGVCIAMLSSMYP